MCVFFGILVCGVRGYSSFYDSYGNVEIDSCKCVGYVVSFKGNRRVLLIFVIIDIY